MHAQRERQTEREREGEGGKETRTHTRARARTHTHTHTCTHTHTRVHAHTYIHDIQCMLSPGRLVLPSGCMLLLEALVKLCIRPVRRVGIFFLEAIFPWWSRSQNHRIFLFQTFPETHSGESGIFLHQNTGMVLGWGASFPIPNSKIGAVRKSKNRKKGRCRKSDNKRAVPKFKCRTSLARRKIFHARLLRPESLARKIFRRARLFHIPY